jgi:hypothetical protein
MVKYLLVSFQLFIVFIFSVTQNTSLINIDNIKTHLEYLGSDSLRGRGTGSEGEYLAASYIVSQFKSYDLKPLGDQDTFYQNIPMHGSSPLPSSSLKIFNGSNVKELQLGKDYLLYKTGASTFIPKPLPLVFVGYGIIAPEFDYNDYLSIDVQGKIAVFLSGEPFSSDNDFFDGDKPTIYSSPEAKQRMALSRGARGSIMIPLPSADAYTEWQYWVSEFAFENITLAYTVSSHTSILMYPASAEILFQNSENSLEEILRLQDQGRLYSFDLNSKMTFEGVFDERDFVARNILAIRRGTDVRLNDSYIIVSAHYDHLGIGPPVQGDSIYNGVLDNALGTATLLEISRLFALDEGQTKRSVIFLLTTGEEKGILGSTYYTDHPAVPLYKTVANVNIDGVAAFEEFNDIIGIGTEFSSLKFDLEKVAVQLNLRIGEIPSGYFYESQNINRSDQFAFMKAGIPSVLLVEGVNYKSSSRKKGIDRMIDWNQMIYHTPFDDLNQSINYSAVRQHAFVIYTFIKQVAISDVAPTWNPGVPFINARLQSNAEKR